MTEREIFRSSDPLNDQVVTTCFPGVPYAEALLKFLMRFILISRNHLEWILLELAQMGLLHASDIIDAEKADFRSVRNMSIMSGKIWALKQMMPVDKFQHFVKYISRYAW